MFFYIFLLIVVWIFSICYSFTTDKYNTFLFKSIVFVVLFVPSALRYNIGTDYKQYVDIYSLIEKNGFREIEYGYYLLNLFAIKTGLGVEFVFALMAFLTYYFFIKYVPRKSCYILIPFYLMILYIHSYNLMRQCLAISSALYAYLLFQNKNYFKTFIILLFGFMFHKGAIIYPIIFILIKIINISKIQSLSLFVVIFIMQVFTNQIIGFIGNIFQKNNLPYAFYFSSKLFGFKTVRGTGIGILLRFLCYFISLLCIDGNHKNSSMNRAGFLMLIFADVLVIGGLDIFSRLVYSFYIFWFPVLNNIIKSKNKYHNIIIMFIMAFFLMNLFILLSVSKENPPEVIPYRSILSK
ncbi:hypothetical protein AGMMS49546_27130 [Spirochaetia bacterium]|nr:hypothetical protein AGMMS49546_27130 [Spirochaetia bacterium]